MAGHFDFLAKAKPASLYKVLEKLPTDEAAIVLTGVPHALAVQSLAFFPDELQGMFLPLMRAARSAPLEDREKVAGKIHAMLAAAKAARNANAAAPKPPLPAPVKPPLPGRTQSQPPLPATPIAEAATPLTAIIPGGVNPYSAAAKPKEPPAEVTKPSLRKGGVSAVTGLGSLLKEALGMKGAAAAPGETTGSGVKKTGKPSPWVPRAATSSPINGPALPGKPPPIAGDPFASPLARAGLMDIIGRAQDKLMPKGTVAKSNLPAGKAPARPRLGKDGRPEAREGVARAGEIRYSRVPREIGPKPAAASGAEGVRRMDGKAILAAILREAGPEVRQSVGADDPGLMRELRGRMFYFDDLMYSDEAALAKVFTAASVKDASLALKFAAPELRRRVMRAVSPGRAKALGGSGGRAGFEAVEAAQKRVLDVALQLQAAGRILIDPRDPDLAK